MSAKPRVYCRLLQRSRLGSIVETKPWACSTHITISLYMGGWRQAVAELTRTLPVVSIMLWGALGTHSVQPSTTI